MYRLTLLCCAAKKKLFELFCREQLLVNFSLRELSPATRRAVMAKMFKELPKETLKDLKQQATIEESRLEALKRAAASFKPLTPYEFFVTEQRNNPALGTSTSPRDREVKLLQIYETLPERAKEALATRAEKYNAERSKLPEAPVLPVIPVTVKKVAPAKANKKKAAKKKKTKSRSLNGATSKAKKLAAKAAMVTAAEEEQVDNAQIKATKKTRASVSPYSFFVKEQMASLHHLAPKERMRVIGERWRSLTSEERERRLETSRAKIAAEMAMKRAAHAEVSNPENAAGALSSAPAVSSVPSPSSDDGAGRVTTLSSPPAPFEVRANVAAASTAPPSISTSVATPPS